MQIPKTFKYVVTSEKYENEITYVAVALEWHMAGQGNSPDDAIDSLERILVLQTHIIANPDQDCQHIDMLKAPDDYFRAYENGQFICTEEGWSDCIPNSKVCARGILDINNSQYRVKYG